ncbi:MAG: DNA internalization-related competence protein ComEC/Rec2 [Polyangiales bacterium]|nr:DNA internalization-related competence protein ComEC/Rec2 [Myxococcales bacterium]MCB9659073.1 DNA internalization-related competence protein ComEC/Rec2 [Sandaracinaceae bacterium]
MPWLVGAWVLGVFLSVANECTPRVWPAALALAIATLLALLGGWLRARLWLAPLTLLAALSGLSVGVLPSQAAPPGLYRLTGEVLSVRRRSEDQRVTLRVERSVALDGRRTAQLVDQRVRVDFPADDALVPGSRVRALVRLRPPTTFHNRTPHPVWPVDATFAAAGRSVADGPPTTLSRPLVGRAVAWAREALRASLDQTLPDDVAGLAVALVLGDGAAADQEQRDAMRDAGMAHLLAVSGLHVGLVGMFMVGLLRRLFVRLDVLRPDRWAALAGVPCVLLHANLAGGSASAMRAAFTACLGMTLAAVGRRPRPLGLMAAACLVLAFLDPRATVNPGFWLSVCATAAILTAERPKDPRFPALATAWSITWRTTVATAPVTWWCFSGVPLLGLLANLVLLPLGALVVVPLANVHALLACVLPTAAGALSGPVLATVCRALVHGATVFARPAWGLGLPPLTLSEGLVVGATCMLLLAVRGRARALALATACVLFVASEAALRHQEQPQGALRVTFLDVGQGDSAIVDLPNGEALLIDAGGGVPDPGAHVVAPLLAARRRSALRAVMISHPHPDHFGGLASVLASVQPSEVWDTGQGQAEHPDMPYAQLLRGLAGRGISVRGPDSLCGSRDLGGARMELLWPCPRFDAGHDANDNSFVMKLSYAGRSVLFVGDAEHEAEAALVAMGERIRADVLKVGHHGSRTSSTESFLTAVGPSFAVASQGRDNGFGHPHEDVVERYARLGIPLYLTSHVGGVTIRTDGGPWEVDTTLTPSSGATSPPLRRAAPPAPRPHAP